MSWQPENKIKLISFRIMENNEIYLGTYFIKIKNVFSMYIIKIH